MCLVTGRDGEGGFFNLKCTGDSAGSLDGASKLKDVEVSSSIRLVDAVGGICGATIGLLRIVC